MQISRRACVCFVFACLATVRLHARITEEVRGSLKTLESIAGILDDPDDRPVHILYIHGINATAPDDSGPLRLAICTRLHLCEANDWQDAGRDYPDTGVFAPHADPPALTYLGTQVWHKQEPQEWMASAPYVQHWVVRLRHHRALVVLDELNWWPLVMKLKCQQIMTNDAYLAGPNKTLIGLCARNTPAPPEYPGRFDYYPWIKNPTPLLSQPSRAALVNRSLKIGLEDWGFSDAFLGVGPLRDIIEEGIRQLIAKSAAFDPRQGSAKVTQGRQAYDWKSKSRHTDETDQEFVAVTHSLGSFLLLDTFENDREAEKNTHSTDEENQALEYVRDRTVMMYFFANQVPLLELANLKSPSSPAAVPGAAPEAHQETGEETELLGRWVQARQQFTQTLKADDPGKRLQLQLVAFSDPSDLLTWRVRPISHARVVNLFVRNAFRWFGIIAAPLAAHDNYAKNKDVLRVMFEKPRK